MKILMVNITCTYGSTGAITNLLKERFENEGHEVFVCYGTNNQIKVPANSYKVTFRGEGWFSSKIGEYSGLYGLGNFMSTWKIKRLIHKIKPDVINLFNLHGSYVNDLVLLNYIRKHDIPTVYTMLDEYAYMGRCCFSYECTKFKTFCHDCSHLTDYPRSLFFDNSSYYFKKKKEIYERFRNIVFVGETFAYGRSKESALLKDKQIELIQEPIDYDNTYYPRKTEDLRKELNIPNSNIVILTITNYGDERKGGRFFFELYEQMKDLPGYSFVFVGYNEATWGRKEGVVTIPYVIDKDMLASYFSLADIFVFTSLADTSPSTVQQALGCGSPVCAFDIEGIRNMNIRDTRVMKLAHVKDIEELKHNVIQFKKKDELTILKCRESVYEAYNISSIYKKYLELYNSIIKG